MRSLFTYLKWSVSKENANKAVKMFTSCRFIPVSVMLVENIPEMIPERSWDKVSVYCPDSKSGRNLVSLKIKKRFGSVQFAEKKQKVPVLGIVVRSTRGSGPSVNPGKTKP